MQTTTPLQKHFPDNLLFKMDRQSVFTSRLYFNAAGENEDSNTAVRTLLENFILDFRLDNIFIYRFGFLSLDGATVLD